MNKQLLFKKLTAAFLLCVFVFPVCACASAGLNSGAADYGYYNGGGFGARDSSQIDFSGISFKAWDVQKATSQIKRRNIKPYTVMVYMNGSDLESQYGAATLDLIEMLDSGLNSANANVIILTGGTNRWQNNIVPSASCALWEIADGKISRLSDIGLYNMGNPGTLCSFIQFGLNNFPAEKTGLIMWDHGGGSIAGYGHDEKFSDGTLTLLEMNYAFEKSGLKQNKLEFLGFDACLMATAEMAVIASEYSHYLVASEDLEPGYGWDYKFLSALNNNRYIGGDALGKHIVDSFMDFYGNDYDDDIALSVVDLSGAGTIMNSMGNLMRLCSQSLSQEKFSSFSTLSKKRNGTKTFGVGSPRDNESDMVDIKDMALKLSDLYPGETAEIFAELDKYVVYNRHNSETDLGGLSAYYIFGGKSTAQTSLATYNKLAVDGNYTAYQYDFCNYLNGKKSGFSRAAGTRGGEDDIICSRTTAWAPVSGKNSTYIMVGSYQEQDTGISPEDAYVQNSGKLWPKINGKNVCLYKINGGKKKNLFAVPVLFNGENADIIVMVCEKYPEGKIMGARKEEGFIIQKGYDEIADGDKISFCYEEKIFSDAGDCINWVFSDEITVNGGLKLTFEPLQEEGLYYCQIKTDVQNNKIFGDLLQVSGGAFNTSENYTITPCC